MEKIIKDNNSVAVSCSVYFFVLLAIIYLISGCSVYDNVSKKTKDVARDFKALDKDLKKKVATFYFSNQTSLSDRNLENNFQDNLLNTINSICPGISALPATKIVNSDYFNDLQKQGKGKIDTFELVKLGRLYGLNAILMVTLTGVGHFEEQKGIWWFKDTHYFLWVQMDVEALDTETGTKLLDEIIKRIIEVDEYDLELLMSKNRIDAFVLEDAFDYIAGIMGEKICDTLIIQPWKGYITEITEDQIIISSGIESGLAPGMVLEVFNSTETIDGANNRRFFIPGQKTGEIKITAVYADSTQAVLVSGSVIQEGSLVKVKD